ncbi:cytochrome ubiquinol oxidase subunit I [Streptomyces polyrhachis]|uniref:Cytochrome ubiquinol oxidase subunit I n=1 Tax=Streptomyces polyrhachis TaxID=1282885 RepID=A0ABW2GD49_9ACTN
MNAVDLGRLQFAVTALLHFSFVVLTLGLAPVLAWLTTRAAWARDADRRAVLERMARFWGQVYVVNYALGIVSGLVMEFQFGLSWTGLSRLTGDVFGRTLALETILAFFLESTFLGVWILGRGRLPRWAHVGSFYAVTLTAYASAFWIMVTNGFLQHPVGYARRPDGTMRLTDLTALLGNEGALPALIHLATAALAVAGFLMAGASAWQFLHGTRDPEVFRRSLRTGVVVGLAGIWLTVGDGFAQLRFVESQSGKSAAIHGDTAALARIQADLAERLGPGEHAPPAWLAHAYNGMQSIGYLCWLIAVVAACFFFRRRIERSRVLLRILLFAVPLPYVAVLCGWLIRELGRQPWAVYGQLTVTDALSDVSAGSMLFSLLLFAGALGALAVTDWLLIARLVRRGTDRMLLWTTEDEEAARVAPKDPVKEGTSHSWTSSG